MKNNLKISLFLCLISLANPILHAQTADTSRQIKSNIIADEGPVPVAGYETYNKYLREHIMYPRQAMDAEAMGTVRVTLTIDSLGNISSVDIKKDTVHYGCAEEVIRIIHKMEPLFPWKPGKIAGKTAKTRITIPVKFYLTKKDPLLEKKKKKKKFPGW